TMAMQKLPLILPAENMQTTSGPMHRLIERGKALEQAGETEIVSIFGVQPWLDIPEMGCSVVVVTNGDQRAAERHASDLASDFWRSRREFDVELTPVDKAIRQALAVEGGPVVFAESSDSTGSAGRWTRGGKAYTTGVEPRMGRSVVLEGGQVRILIAEWSAMTVDPELFRSHGIDPQRMKIVVVKSPNGFRAEYEPIAKKIF